MTEHEAMIWLDGITDLMDVQFSSVQLFSRVWLFATSWIAARQASLSITNSWSLPKLMSIESVMPSSHLILCRPLLLLPPTPPIIGVFSNEWCDVAINVCVQISIWVFAFSPLGYMPRSTIVVSYGWSVFNLLGEPQYCLPHLFLFMLLYGCLVRLVSFTIHAAWTVFGHVSLLTKQCACKVVSDQINAVGLRIHLTKTFISLE